MASRAVMGVLKGLLSSKELHKYNALDEDSSSHRNRWLSLDATSPTGRTNIKSTAEQQRLDEVQRGPKASLADGTNTRTAGPALLR